MRSIKHNRSSSSRCFFAMVFFFSFVLVTDLSQAQNIVDFQETVVTESNLTEIPLMCKQRKDFFVKARGYSTDLSEGIYKHVTKDVQIIFLGEEHGNYKEETIPPIVSSLREKNSKLNCYLLERYDYKTSFQHFSNFNKGSDLPHDNKIHESELRLFYKLRSIGVKVFPVDDVNAIDSFKNGFTAWTNYRDEFMFNNINKLLSSGECAGVVMPIGLAHLVQWSDPNRKNILEYTKANNLNTMQILLLTPLALQSYFISPTWAWTKNFIKTNTLLNSNLKDQMVCDELPNTPSRPTYFPTSQLPDSRVVIEAFTSGKLSYMGRYKEFEGVIIFPPSELSEMNRSIFESLQKKGIKIY